MKTLKRIIIIQLIVLIVPLFLVAEEDTHHLFIATSLNFGIHSIRYGINEWEGGVLNNGSNMASLGIAKIMKVNRSYTGFGIVLQQKRDREAELSAGNIKNFIYTAGFYGAIGIEFKWASWLAFRMEMNGEVYFGGITQGNSLVGFLVQW